jgi:hypothetical protein
LGDFLSIFEVAIVLWGDRGLKRYGSEGMAASRNGATVINNYNSAVNVTANDADSFRATDTQIARRQRLLQERSKR